MMFRSQSSRELQHVDPPGVFHARQRLCAKAFLRKEIKSCTAHPIVHERIRASVTGVTRLQTFLENFVELKLERVNVSDAWGAGRHPLRLLVPELQEIEIESAIRNLLRACKRFFGDGEQRKTRRQRERFLRASKHHINAQCVHVDL